MSSDDWGNWPTPKLSEEGVRNLVAKAQTRVVQRRHRRRAIRTGAACLMVMLAVTTYWRWSQSTFETNVATARRLIEQEIQNNPFDVDVALNDRTDTLDFQEVLYDRN